MLSEGLLPGRFEDYQDVATGWGIRRAMALEWLATRCGLLRATAILADSEYVRWELVNKFRIGADKIHLIHLAPDRVFSMERSLADIETVRARYHLPSRFVLGVASFSRTKNTEGLLSLASGLAEAAQPPMVLVGPAGAVKRYAQLARDERLVPGKTVFLLHNIPDDDLACLYRAADVFVNLAWEESFGLPIVEAMAGGTAVVGSNRTAVPEIIGAGGLVVDPVNSDAVFRVVRDVLTDRDLRADLKGRALSRAADFSWEKTARGVAAVYDRALGREGR
jgi:glycosyltransferase involved in cell wall biosynthesis